MDHKWLFLYLILAAITTNIPVIGVYFSLCNTLIHEFSHALVASVFTRKLTHTISLYHNASGLAVTSINSWFARVAVAYAGYTGSSMASIGLFYLLENGKYHLIIGIFTCVTVICALLWVRNIYGFFWSLSIIFLMGWMLYKQMDGLMMHVSIFISSIVLVQSVITAMYIMKLSFIQRKEAGDATSLADTTYIPAPIWGLIFFGQSLYAVWIIYSILF